MTSISLQQAHDWLENKQRMMTENRWAFSSIDIEANGIAIESIEQRINNESNLFTHICKSDRDIYPTEFTIYAYIINEDDEAVLLDRYMKYGAIHVGEVRISRSDFERYYEEIKYNEDSSDT